MIQRPMASVFDTAFGDCAAPNLMTEHGASVSYTASGASAVTRTGIWAPDVDNVIPEQYQEYRMRTGTLHLYDDATNGVATVTPQEDTVVIDSVTYSIENILTHAGGLWSLRCEETEVTVTRRSGRKLGY